MLYTNIPPYSEVNMETIAWIIAYTLIFIIHYKVTYKILEIVHREDD